MSWRDELKKSQKAGKSFPKLDIKMTLDLTTNEQGEPVFKFYNKEKEESIIRTKSFPGVIIGRAMQIIHFSPSIGRKGGNYVSNHHFMNKNIVLWMPEGNNFKMVCKGTYDDVVACIGNKPHREQSIFILNKSGLFCIRANLSLMIDQFKKVETQLGDNVFNLVPTIYDPDSKEISSKTHKILGPLARTNRPIYCRIEVLDPITDALAIEINLEQQAKVFNEFREFSIEGGDPSTSIETAKEEEVTASAPDLPFGDEQTTGKGVDISKEDQSNKQRLLDQSMAAAENNPEDDLPF